jgi:hypothetical protein
VSADACIPVVVSSDAYLVSAVTCIPVDACFDADVSPVACLYPW